jgi:bifunctional DNase/RNase
MERTRLQFENLQNIVGTTDIAVIMLTDSQRKRAITVVCDDLMSRQIVLRLKNPEKCLYMLPEALMPMMSTDFEMTIVGIYDGQYQVMLTDFSQGVTSRIRISDAVLLNISARVPLFIEEGLMKQQCVAFEENASGVAIPINTMDMRGLRKALEHAVEEENYEFASQIRDEMNRRSNKSE